MRGVPVKKKTGLLAGIQPVNIVEHIHAPQLTREQREYIIEAVKSIGARNVCDGCGVALPNMTIGTIRCSECLYFGSERGVDYVLGLGSFEEEEMRKLDFGKWLFEFEDLGGHTHIKVRVGTPGSRGLAGKLVMSLDEAKELEEALRVGFHE